MTILQQLLGIELPIVQAPMAGVQDSALALAVGAGGGLGSLPCALLGGAALREQLAALGAGGHLSRDSARHAHGPLAA